MMVSTLKGCAILGTRFEYDLAPLQGAILSHLVPVVFAPLRPPATVSQPFGLQNTFCDKTHQKATDTTTDRHAET